MPAGRTLEGAQLTQFKSGQNHIRDEFSGLIGPKKIGSVSAPAGPVQVAQK
jgi:hypothetical protein